MKEHKESNTHEMWIHVTSITPGLNKTNFCRALKRMTLLGLVTRVDINRRAGFAYTATDKLMNKKL